MATLLSVPDVAARFGVTNQTVRNWIASGRLAGVQASARGRHRISAGALEAFEREAAGRTRRSERERREGPIDAELARVVSAIAASLHPDAVVLFGSRARGAATGDADFDLAIIVAEGVPRRRVAMKAYESLAGVEGRTVGVDIVVLTPHIIAAERDLVGSIAGAVARDGVRVYGSAGFV